jgi:hypothetical protein
VVPPRAARERALDQTRSGGSVRPRPRRKHVRVPPGRGRLSTRRGVPCNPSMVLTARCERVTGPRPRGAARAVPRGTRHGAGPPSDVRTQNYKDVASTIHEVVQSGLVKPSGNTLTLEASNNGSIRVSDIVLLYKEQ